MKINNKKIKNMSNIALYNETYDIQLPKGIRIGHADNDYTGVSVIMTDFDCVAGVDVRGAAPGTRETELLKSEKMIREVQAIVLCGGSAYGLSAVDGVMQYLRERKRGYYIKNFDKYVPIVPSAVIFDLDDAEYNFPDKEMGYLACVEANLCPKSGSVGVGRGATVGKIRGPKNTSRGGVGIATVTVMGVMVTAFVVVNAFGDVYDHKNGKIIAGALDRGGQFFNTNKSMLDGKLLRLLMGVGKSDENSGFDVGGNTTIGCIITDAKLDKVEANKLASISHNGLAQSIKPVHTDYDGDTMFCLATGKKKVFNFAFLQAAAVEAASRAITNAIEYAKKSEKEVIE
ncbi:MAG: P1 family peptidase [Firmicutes bacterium]|nr:P1 family peptidase [Bacillota bacterium]